MAEDGGLRTMNRRDFLNASGTGLAGMASPGVARRLLLDAGAENLQTELWCMPIPRLYMPDGAA